MCAFVVELIMSSHEVKATKALTFLNILNRCWLKGIGAFSNDYSTRKKRGLSNKGSPSKHMFSMCQRTY